MTLKVETLPYWHQSYNPDYSQGWVSGPKDGTKLGRLQVAAEVPRGQTFTYRTLDFTGHLSYFKHVYHNAPPSYDFEGGAGRVTARSIPEAEVPQEVLTAFAGEVDPGFRM